MLGKYFPDMLLFSKRKPHKSNAFLVVFQAGGSGSEGWAWDDSRLLSERVGPSEEKVHGGCNSELFCFTASSFLHF